MSSSLEVIRNHVKLAQFAKTIDEYRSYEKLKKIVESGFDINYAVPDDKDYSGYTALHFSVYEYCRAYNSLNEQQLQEVLKLLLSREPDVTKKNADGYTPLSLAYHNQNIESNLRLRQMTMFNLLLAPHLQFDNAANPCCKDGISHFHIACIVNNIDVVRYFLNSGVSVNQTINPDSVSWPGCTPLHLVMHNEDPDIVRLLLDYGAIESLNAKGKSPLHVLIEKQIEDAACDDVTERNKKFLKNEEVLDVMIPTDRFSVDSVGLSRFHVYCARNQSFQPEVLEEFLRNGADVNAPIDSKSPVWPGYRPIHFAALCNLKAVILLLKNGANLLDADATGTTALDLCVKRYNPVEVSSILEAQEPLNTVVEKDVKLTNFLRRLKTTEILHLNLTYDSTNTVIPLDSPIWPGYSLLHLAVYFSRNDDVSLIQTCLRHGANIMIQGKNGMTALHLAYRLDKVKCVIEILYACPDAPANPTDKDGLSHFHIACATSDTKVVKLYLLSGLDPNLPLQTDLKDVPIYDNEDEVRDLKTGFRPLHIAMAIESESLIELLMEHNADPLLLNAEGLTWIHYAFMTINRHCLEYYTEFMWMSPKTLESNPVALGGLSHFHVACFTGHLETVQALLPLVSNINEPLNIDLKDTVMPSYVSMGDTPLHLATKSNKVELVDFLLKNGADVNARNAENHQVLQALFDIDFLDSKVTALLVSELEAQGKWVDEETGFTLLHVACYMKDEHLIKRYFEAGQDPNWQMKKNSNRWTGNTPLTIIKRHYYSNETATRLLFDYILRFYKNEISSNQPLHDSIKRQKINHSSSESSKFLLHTEIDILFRLSCQIGFIDIIEKLIKMGIDVNAPTNHFKWGKEAGYTPLHFAVKYDKAEIIELLLHSGANYKLEDSNGNTPLHLAASEKPHLLQIFWRSTKIDIEIRNAFDKTVYEILLKRRGPDDQNHILDFFKQVDMKKMIFATKNDLVEKLVHELSKDAFKSVISCISNLNYVDDNGRNVIHSIAASEYEGNLKPIDLSMKIEFLEQISCDIDHQDHQGMTPLHYAVRCENVTTVEALLLIGVDINVVDIHGQAACYYPHENYDDVDDTICSYIGKIKASGQYLHPQNDRFFSEHNNDWMIVLFRRELNAMKPCSIGGRTYHNQPMYPLLDIFTDEMVVRFPLMPRKLRDIITNFVDSCHLEKYFPNWLPLMKLQRRRALKREKLFKTAVDALQYSDVIDERLPQNCLESILTELSNEDLMNLIVAKDLVVE